MLKPAKRRTGLMLAALMLGGGVAFGALSSGVSGRDDAAAATNTTVVCTAPDAAGELKLTVAQGYASFPDGNGVYMWGYTIDDADDAWQTPGPVLCVKEGDVVTVKLTVPAGFPESAISIMFPGQTGVTASGGTPGLFTNEASPGGGTVTYTFTASQPGTYLYESGTNPTKQIQMGLAGAIIVRPAMGANFAYDDASTRFDPNKEYLLLLNEVDPNLHHAVEIGQPYTPSTTHFHYWTINGRSFPDTIAPNDAPWLPGQPYGALVQVEAQPNPPGPNDYPALVRYANAGQENHPFHPHGNHLRIIAQDGRLLTGPSGEILSSEAFTKTVASGQTFDLLARWLNVDVWSAASHPIPVQLPGLQNLIFIDGATFYSGSPYLDDKGRLPPGTTSFNECGEFYFPWHSHALFEVQNFDEGFGGMLTLWRVDPPEPNDCA
jgi:FtsP/CotA-like multicopper oxidase with cupredoxin domain